MDISSELKCVSNLNEYISVTQDIASKYINSRILFNMSTVLSLKKVKSLEIEYFNKCDESGAAVIVFELILQHPPTKTWGLLGTELISLIKYWLEAIRKHLIFHHNHWWNFTSTLMTFIEKICLKSKSIQDVLVQETSECLLDLATNSRTDSSQSYQIIHCFNMCCAESSRAVRIAHRRNLDTFLERVAGAVRASGDARVQLAGAQALVRWTVPRARRAVRVAAADAWLAPHRYPPSAVAAFVDAAWRNFPQDVRKFLNALNAEGSAVVSLRCRSCTAGGAELVTAAGGEHWLDASAGSRSLALHAAADDAALLLVRDEDVHQISLFIEGGGAAVRVRGRGGAGRAAVRAVLAPEPRALRRLHALLRDTFAHRYTTSTDFDSSVGALGADTENEDLRAEEAAAGGGGRAARAGCASRASAAPLSPSTASTSSLLMLRDKLTAFIGAAYDKEPATVCAAPQLSDVTEATEPDDGPRGAAPGASAVWARPARPPACLASSGARARSDGSDASRDTRDINKYVSPIAEEDESSVSMLLVAAGSAEDSVVGETPDRLATDGGVDDVVDSLAREALQHRRPTPDPAGPASRRRDPGEDDVAPPAPRERTVISDTTTDDSAAEFVENTPIYSSRNDRKNSIASEREDNLNFDNRDVENFFSRHLAESDGRDAAVSPALARRINRSSSESSAGGSALDSIDDLFVVHPDVFECLNTMLDAVCENLEKCAGYLRSSDPTIGRRSASGTAPRGGTEEGNEAKTFKIKFDSGSTKMVKRGRPGRKKNVSKSDARPSRDNEGPTGAVPESHAICEKDSKNSCNAADARKTPDARRKRKLYSPKDDFKIDDGECAPPREGTPDARKKSTNTPYKEIENIRNKSLMNTRRRIRTPRSALSPRTQKLNDAFDSLKSTIEGEKITFAPRNTRNRAAVYNFPSDSDDDDFKEKGNRTTRRVKGGGGRPPAAKSTRVRQPKSEKLPKGPSASGRSRKKPTKKNAIVDRPRVELEQMRAPRPEGSERLDVSFEATRSAPGDAEPEPAVAPRPKMEFVEIYKDDSVAEKRSTRGRPKRVDSERDAKHGRTRVPSAAEAGDKDVTVSPLPGLVVEEIRAQNDGNSASVCTLEALDISADKNLSLLDGTQNILTDADGRLRLEGDPDAAASYDSGARRRRQLSTRKKKLNDTVIQQEPETHAPRDAAADRRVIDLDTGSETSIPTLGKSPITAHGDLDEAPPSSRLLRRRVTERRGIEASDLSATLQVYYDKLSRAIEDPAGDCGSPGGGRGRKAAAGRHTEDASVAKLSPVVSVARLSPDVVGRWIPLRRDSVSGSAPSSTGGDASRPTSRRVPDVARVDDRDDRDGRTARASIISPILLFGEGAARRRSISRSSSLSRAGLARRTARDAASKASPPLTDIKVSSSRTYDLRSQKLRAGTDSPSVERADDIQSESGLGSPRRSYAGEGRSPKRRRVAEDAGHVDVASSVGEWMARNVADDAPAASESDDSSARDNIDAVLEKLDTTLQEIHYNTSKKLVSLLAEMGRGAAALRAERERLYRAGVRDLLAHILTVVDDKFTDLERRCGELGAAWERGLRERARAVLRDDCRQKRDLLALLRDDLRAARPRPRTRPRRH